MFGGDLTERSSFSGASRLFLRKAYLLLPRRYRSEVVHFLLQCTLQVDTIEALIDAGVRQFKSCQVSEVFEHGLQR
jgi:hypothetical protein